AHLYVIASLDGGRRFEVFALIRGPGIQHGLVHGRLVRISGFDGTGVAQTHGEGPFFRGRRPGGPEAQGEKGEEGLGAGAENPETGDTGNAGRLGYVFGGQLEVRAGIGHGWEAPRGHGKSATLSGTMAAPLRPR